MAFTFKARRPFSAPVTVHVPQADGTMAELSFTGHFVILPESERQSIGDAAVAAGDENRAKAVLMQAVTGWGADLLGEDGAPLPFSRETLAALLDDVAIFIAVNTAYGAGILGQKDLTRKN